MSKKIDCKVRLAPPRPVTCNVDSHLEALRKQVLDLETRMGLPASTSALDAQRLARRAAQLQRLV